MKVGSRNLIDLLISGLDSFLHPKIRSAGAFVLVRARVFVFWMLISAPLLAVMYRQFHIAELGPWHPMRLIYYYSAVELAVIFAAFRIFGSYKLAMYALLGSLYLNTPIMIAYSGGLHSPSIMYYIFLPFGIFQVTKSLPKALIGVAIGTIELLVLYAMHVDGWDFVGKGFFDDFHSQIAANTLLITIFPWLILRVYAKSLSNVYFQIAESNRFKGVVDVANRVLKEFEEPLAAIAADSGWIRKHSEVSGETRQRLKGISQIVPQLSSLISELKPSSVVTLTAKPKDNTPQSPRASFLDRLFNPGFARETRWKIVPSLLILFFCLMPILIYRTGGLESGFINLYALPPLLGVFLSGSRTIWILSILMSVAQVIVLSSLLPFTGPEAIFANEHFYLHVLFTATLVTAVMLLTGWMYSVHMEAVNKRAADLKKFHSIATMVNGLSHEVNNPLSALSARVSLALKLMEEGRLNAPLVKQQMGEINGALERVRSVIRKLEVIASIPKAHERIRFDLVALLISVLEKHEGILELLAERPATSTALYVEGVPELMIQCLSELFENAMDTVRKTDEPWIRIKIKRKKAGVAIIITNSGAPLSKEAQAKIFDPFFTTKEVGSGMGLGLSVCQAIVEMHDGTIHYNAGAAHPQFVVTLPLNEMS